MSATEILMLVNLAGLAIIGVVLVWFLMRQQALMQRAQDNIVQQVLAALVKKLGNGGGEHGGK